MDTRNTLDLHSIHSFIQQKHRFPPTRFSKRFIRLLQSYRIITQLISNSVILGNLTKDLSAFAVVSIKLPSTR